MKQARIQSMTGFSTAEGDIAGQRYRIELKALNHRYLEVKVRMARELSAAEMPLRTAIQARFSRGALEVKLERVTEAGNAPPAIQANLALAAHYYESLIRLQKTLGLNDPIRTIDVASFPEVISKGAESVPLEDGWKSLEPIARQALDRLVEMREHEGAELDQVLRTAAADLETAIHRLREQRALCEADYRKKIRDKIKTVFEAYPIAESSVQTVLDSRISQELALLLDRTDIEEELVRFKGHLDHLRKVLDTGGTVGRKLDFILQELNREINTLGNKAQDFSMSEEVVRIKVRLEQLREQVMNLE